MQIICLDLEGVLVPEIWIKFAEKTGIESLKATTRDIQDYNELMKQRLRILDENNLNLEAIQAVISDLKPMPGAREFLDALREKFQVIILSDTFYEFAKPLMKQLAWPTLFCHKLQVSENGRVTDYVLRQQDPKRESVKALKRLQYTVFAAGDSYNDTSMLEEADEGFLFRAPKNVLDEFPQYKITSNYNELKGFFENAAIREW